MEDCRPGAYLIQWPCVAVIPAGSEDACGLVVRLVLAASTLEKERK